MLQFFVVSLLKALDSKVKQTDSYQHLNSLSRILTACPKSLRASLVPWPAFMPVLQMHLMASIDSNSVDELYEIGVCFEQIVECCPECEQQVLRVIDRRPFSLLSRF